MDSSTECICCLTPWREAAEIFCGDAPSCLTHYICGECRGPFEQAQRTRRGPILCPFDRQPIHQWIGPLPIDWVEPPAPPVQIEPDTESSVVPPAARARYQCYHCNSDFVSRGSRSNHMAQVHTARGTTVVCPTCSRSYKRSYNLRQHQRRTGHQ